MSWEADARSAARAGWWWAGWEEREEVAPCAIAADCLMKRTEPFGPEARVRGGAVEPRGGTCSRLEGTSRTACPSDGSPPLVVAVASVKEDPFGCGSKAGAPHIQMT